MAFLFAGVAFLLSLDVNGVVVDSSGRPVPRAVVQVSGADGSNAQTTFTGADGAFHVASAPDGCRLQVSLAGFVTATALCDANGAIRLTLAPAPVAEHVIVSATRTDAPAGQVGSASTVFDAGDIDRRQEPLLADLLRDAPGAMIVRTGAPGGVTSLFVRGGESNYTKVLIDGIPMNEPGGAFDLSNITTDNLDRVEFIRGANSALYGSDAMTGLVQLFTRRGTPGRPQFRARIEGGSFSTARGSAGVSGRSGPLDYSLDAGGLTTDNEVPNDRFRNATVSGSAGAALGHGASLRVIGRLERGHAGTPGQTAFGRPDLDAFYTRHDGVWGVSFDESIGPFHQRAAYGLATSRQASTNLLADPPYTPSFDGHVSPFQFSDFAFDSRTSLTRHRASYQADATTPTARLGTHVDSALADWDGERATLRDALAGTSVPASRDNVGVTLQHQALWSRVFVTAGVRFEHNASFGNAAVPRAAAAWYAHTGDGGVGSTRVHASAGRGIKEPTILQSFSLSPYFLGNPALRPERARTFDAGVEQRLARDRVAVDVTWFDNRYRDIVALRTVDPATFRSQYFNIGLTRARGAELTGSLALASGFQAKTGYTFLDSRILQSTSAFSEVFKAGNPAFRRPRHSGFVDVAWTHARGSVDVVGTFVGGRADSDFASLAPPIEFNQRYAQWDVRGLVRVTHALSVTAAVDNAGGRRYMEPLGYPALGRAFRAGIRLGT